MHALQQDLRYAFRQLRKNPGITLVVVLTVALGIGMNTAIFSLVNGFLRPLRVKSPGQIVVLAAQTKGDETGFEYRFSYPALEDFRRQSDSFSDLFAFNAMLGGLGADGKTTPVLYSAVTGNFFTALGLTPATGRLFLPGEGEHPGAELIVVLGHSYWRKRFGGSPRVVGRQIRLDGKTARIVGVVPKGFYGLYAGAEMDCYLPLNSMAVRFGEGNRFFTNRGSRPLTVYGRMKPGVTIAHAENAVNVLYRRLSEQYPDTEKGITVRIVPETLARPIPLHVLTAAIPLVRMLILVLAGLVLMLACMNVANILMVRATIRRREMAIRAALGSGRARLLQQTLTESVLLGILGGAAGLLLGKWGSDALAHPIDLATDFPIMLDFSFDWRVFTYALAAALVTGVLVGILPAVRGTRVAANQVLHDGGRGDSGGSGRGRVRGMLVVAQVAGSLVLLIVAGLFARTLEHAQRMDLGFDAAHLLSVRLDPDAAGYNPVRNKDFYRELVRRVQALPGVQSASLAYSVPMGYISDAQQISPEDRQPNPGEQAPAVGCNYVDPAYFDTMRIPMVRGRAFRESDDERAPLVAIVNQTLAARFWLNQDPIGKRFRTKSGPIAEVVGVAHDSKYLIVFEHPLPYFYFPIEQTSITMRTLEVRTLVSPDTMTARVQQEIQAIDPGVPMADLRTMHQSLAGGFGFLLFRIGAIQGAAMGILGLVLAVVGVYGVVSYSASQRTREIGIRLALGAAPEDVRSLVLGHGLRLVLAGVAVGLAATWVFAKLAAGYVLLAGTDPLTFALVPPLLSAIALAACYLPARRAMRVDPMVALRHE